MNKTLINTGFLSTSWHVTSRAMFAGSCVGVLFLVVLLEFLRRLGREYDLFIIRRARLRANCMTKPSCTCSGPSPSPRYCDTLYPKKSADPPPLMKHLAIATTMLQPHTPDQRILAGVPADQMMELRHRLLKLGTMSDVREIMAALLSPGTAHLLWST
ncbi:Ctr copper transporter family-domain-containing protein [Penicillium sp. DV-2018c]|nr:Ctr copper transporter family-domain-containing protein [Penicillium sp. DV-2018c]